MSEPPALRASDAERERTVELLREHSLTLVLVVTGIVWVFVFRAMNPESRWGQVVGNIVSEWTQVLGLVLLTKRLIEVGSKERADRR